MNEQCNDVEEWAPKEDAMIRDCYDAMSLSGCSTASNDNGCLNLDVELEKFDQELHNKSKSTKLVHKHVIKVEEIKQMAKDALNKGPDRNGKAKLEQLEILQKLHVLLIRGHEIA